MMRLFAVVLGAILVFAASGPAAAQTLSGTASGSGAVEIDPLSGGLPGVTCLISASGSVYPGVAPINQADVDPGHPLCGTIEPWGAWMIMPIPSNYSDVEFYLGFDAPGLGTRCYGLATAALSGGVLTFSNVSLPAVLGVNSCYLDGSINLGLSL